MYSNRHYSNENEEETELKEQINISLSPSSKNPKSIKSHRKSSQRRRTKKILQRKNTIRRQIQIQRNFFEQFVHQSNHLQMRKERIENTWRTSWSCRISSPNLNMIWLIFIVRNSHLLVSLQTILNLGSSLAQLSQIG